MFWGNLGNNKVLPLNNRFELPTEPSHSNYFTNGFFRRRSLGRTLLLKFEGHVLAHHFHFVGEESETQTAENLAQLISNCRLR